MADRRSPGAPSPAPGPPGPGPGQPAARPKGTLGQLWHDHPWWFIGGGGALGVVLFVWYQHSKKNQQQQGMQRVRTRVVFTGRGRGGGDHDGGHHHRHDPHAPAAPVDQNAGAADEENLLAQMDTLQSALADYTSTHARDRGPGGATTTGFPMAGGPGGSPQMIPQPF